jgi:hypothetical protein
MKFLGACLTIALLNTIALADDSYVAQSKIGSQQIAATCFKSGEQQSGMNKICYYNCLGGTVAINVSSTSLCPLTIRQ